VAFAKAKGNVNIEAGYLRIHTINQLRVRGFKGSSVVSLTLLYNNLRAVIPAKTGIQIEKTGFRIKSGMTKCVKLFLRHYTRVQVF